MAEAIRSHRDLVVWRRALDLVVAIYRVTATFPHSELYRLTSRRTRHQA